MKTRLAAVLVIYLVAALIFTALAGAARGLAADSGVRRSFYAQAGFGGTPSEEPASEISLDFLDERPDLPRQFFSVRWRGFLFLNEPESVAVFAGGNDEVDLRIDGKLVIQRNIREGFRTTSRTLALDAGAHEIVVDYQQFGGGMSLNIQRAISGGAPGPFVAAELFAQPVRGWRVQVSKAAEWLTDVAVIVWLVLAALLVIAAIPWAILRWRTAGAPRTARAYAHRVWLVAAPAALAPAVLFVLGPHTIFWTNRDEFAVTFRDLALPWLLRTAGTNWFVLFATGCLMALLSERLTRVYGALLLAVGLLLWGQGNLWNPIYGVLAGQELNFGEHAWRAPYELATFSIVLVFALVGYRPVSRLAPFAALVFMGVQIAAAAFSDAQPAVARRARWIEPPREIYQFSRNQNVIHIVLDEFQSDLFTEMLEQDRAMLDRQFSGFEYFGDHAGAFPTTSFSMPAMLAGQEYRNQKPAPEFVRDAFKHGSIFEEVSQAGYEVDAMSIVPFESFEQWLGPEASPNWKGARFRIRKPFVSKDDYRQVSAGQLLELSLFRHLPHTFKVAATEHPAAFYRPLWINRSESPAEVRRHEATNSAAFLEHFTGMMAVGRERPVYKLLHVGVPHRPIVLDRECRFLGQIGMSRQTYLEQSRCAIKLVAAFLERARGLGIYDSSVIIVSSDHGTDLQPLGFNGKSNGLSLWPGPSTVRLPTIVGTAKALMLVKPAHRAGPMTISEAPTSHVDLPATILDLLGLPGGTPSASMLRRDPKQPRTRIYGMYEPSQRFPRAYLDRLDVLSIDGRVVDAAAWDVQRSMWPAGAKLERRDVDIGPRTANPYLGPGWSFELREPTADTTFVRTATNRAVLYASLPPGAAEIVLHASLATPSTTQTLTVEVDGRPAPLVDPGSGDTYREMSIRVPADEARPSISHIALQFKAVGNDPPPFKLDRMIIRGR